jgi:hypothetical protein
MYGNKTMKSPIQLLYANKHVKKHSPSIPPFKRSRRSLAASRIERAS